MTILKALIDLCKSTIDDFNNWYLWPVNEHRLPNGIMLPPGNAYEKNVSLKIALHRKWVDPDEAEKVQLIRYYISTWGGIHGNADKTIQLYSNAAPECLIARGVAGVASWSKALCVRNPLDYAIFDARVSASINALQIIETINSPSLYPVLPTKNGTILKANRYLKIKAKQDGWSQKAAGQYYSDYLELLRLVKVNINIRGVEIYTIEMLLFSKAEELVRKAFPNETF